MSADRKEVKKEEKEQEKKLPPPFDLAQLKHTINSYHNAVIRQKMAFSNVKEEKKLEKDDNKTVFNQYRYRESTIAHDIERIKDKLVKKLTNPSTEDLAKIDKTFADFDKKIELQFYSLLSGKAFEIEESVKKIINDLTPSLNTLNDKDKAAINDELDKLHTQRAKAFEQLNTSIKEAKLTAHSNAIFLEMKHAGINRNFVKLDANSEEIDSDVSKDEQAFKKALTTGQFQKRGSKFILNLDVNKDGQTINFNSGKLTDEDFIEATMQAVDLLMANGAKTINIAFNEFDERYVEIYIKKIAATLAEIQSSKRQVQLHIDGKTLHRLRSSVVNSKTSSHKAYDFIARNKDQSKELETLLTSLQTHNSSIQQKEQDIEKKATETLENIDVNTIADEQNMKDIDNQILSLDKILKEEEKIQHPFISQTDTDNATLQELQKALKVIETQQLRIHAERELAMKAEPEYKTSLDALEKQEEKVKTINDHIQKALGPIQSRVEFSIDKERTNEDKKDYKIDTVKCNDLKKKFDQFKDSMQNLYARFNHLKITLGKDKLEGIDAAAILEDKKGFSAPTPPTGSSLTHPPGAGGP